MPPMRTVSKSVMVRMFPEESITYGPMTIESRAGTIMLHNTGEMSRWGHETAHSKQPRHQATHRLA